MMSVQSTMWIGFAALLAIMFTLDLGVFSRRSHEIKFREALAWTVVWVSLAFAFNAWIYFSMGPTKALEFFTGYIIEESLSVDNLFVFIMIFGYFHIARTHQPKILKWGIIGALVMRGLHLCRDRTAGKVSLDGLHIRRAVDIYRDKDGLRQGRED